MTFFKRHKLAVLIAAGAVLATFFGFRQVPLHRARAAMRNSMIAEQLALAKARSSMKQLPDLRECLEQLRTDVGDFQQRVPSHGPGYGEFLEEITEIMNRHGLRQQSVQPQPEVSMEQVNCVPISIQCAGSLREIFGFFRSLEEMCREVRVSRLQLRNDSRVSGPIHMQLDIGIYYTADG